MAEPTWPPGPGAKEDKSGRRSFPVKQIAYFKPCGFGVVQVSDGGDRVRLGDLDSADEFAGALTDHSKGVAVFHVIGGAFVDYRKIEFPVNSGHPAE